LRLLKDLIFFGKRDLAFGINLPERSEIWKTFWGPPVALTKALNWRFVTGVGSIQKPCNPMDRRFFRVVIVGAHAERAAGNEDHFVGRN